MAKGSSMSENLNVLCSPKKRTWILTRKSPAFNWREQNKTKFFFPGLEMKLSLFSVA
jgi:hypothetical protein